jgi:hypothetical protein
MHKILPQILAELVTQYVILRRELKLKTTLENG